jgi:cytoskeletal protein RodZ
MCGTPLEARRTSGSPAMDPLSAFPPKISPRVTTAPEAVKPAVAEGAARPVNKPVPPISGPSMLGLNQPVAVQSSPSQPSAPSATASPPSIDLLRETSFSSFGSFMEPEEPKAGVGRILLLLVLLAGLGIAGWWAYTNYVGATESRKLQVAISGAEQTPADQTVQKPTDEASQKPADDSKNDPSAKSAAPTAAPDSGSSQASSAPAPPPATSQPENTGSKVADEEAKQAATAKQAPAPRATSRTSPGQKSAAKREPLVAAARTPSRPESAAADTGDAAFRRGEAYLYGRGVRENCDEAVKNLKIASSESNAKARSAFGTMYATGHCVPRDLPTSYLWFALALRADPSNQILEKDLNAVWNQMTPPERQQATRMKQ